MRRIVTLSGPLSARAARLLRLAVLTLSTASAWVVLTQPVKADLRVCNTTQSRVGIAIGYKDQENWITEGWWNLDLNNCETVLRGDLIARYYYVYAIDYDQGGEWGGEAFMCTQDESFTIEGIEECEQRGYMRTGFFEVDVREQRSWTVQLTDPALNGTGESGDLESEVRKSDGTSDEGSGDDLEEAPE